MYPGIVLSFKVHEAGCRFYGVLGTFLVLAVAGTFLYSYLHYPTTRAELLAALLKHYIPLGALLLLPVLAIAYLIKRFGS